MHRIRTIGWTVFSHQLNEECRQIAAKATLRYTLRNVLYFFAAISIGITCNNSCWTTSAILSIPGIETHIWSVLRIWPYAQEVLQIPSKITCKDRLQKNSARRRPVTGRSPRTGEEAQYICSYSEQVRPEAFIIGSVRCFSGMIYPHIQRPDPVNRSMNDQQRIH